jgi:Ca2+-transporting ATPase
MAFVIFVFFQAFDLLDDRDDQRSVFGRAVFENPAAFVATAAVIGLLALIVEMDTLHVFFTTTDLTSDRWFTCLAIGSAILWIGELVEIVLGVRAQHPRPAIASAT